MIFFLITGGTFLMIEIGGAFYGQGTFFTITTRLFKIRRNFSRSRRILIEGSFLWLGHTFSFLRFRWDFWVYGWDPLNFFAELFLFFIFHFLLSVGHFIKDQDQTSHLHFLLSKTNSVTFLNKDIYIYLLQRVIEYKEVVECFLYILEKSKISEVRKQYRPWSWSI